MSEFNFRSIEQLRIPDELTEKLLAIPEESDRKPAVPWYRSKAMIAAASFVLVATLSILIYFSTGNIINKPPVVSPLPQPTASQGESTGTIQADDGTAPSASPHGTLSPTEPQGGTSATSPSGSTGQPSSAYTPSASPSAAPAAPTGQPPTVKKPTEPPTYAPTEPPSSVPVYPTEVIEPYDYYIEDYIDPHEIIEGDVYCWIQNESGEYAGDGAVFTPSHRAVVYVISSDRAYVYWYPGDLYLPPGNYYYTFVDETGKVLASGYERKYP